MNDYLLRHRLEVQEDDLIQTVREFVNSHPFNTEEIQMSVQFGQINLSAHSVGRIARLDVVPLTDKETRIIMQANLEYGDKLLYQVELAKHVIGTVRTQVNIIEWEIGIVDEYLELVKSLEDERRGRMQRIAAV